MIESPGVEEVVDRQAQREVVQKFAMMMMMMLLLGVEGVVIVQNCLSANNYNFAVVGGALVWSGNSGQTFYRGKFSSSGTSLWKLTYQQDKADEEVNEMEGTLDV